VFARGRVHALRMQRRVALVLRPRPHLIRYHGVLAPNATLRSRVVPQGPEVVGSASESAVAASPAEPGRARSLRTQPRPSAGWPCPLHWAILRSTAPHTQRGAGLPR
jgi:hypothetical protein